MIMLLVKKSIFCMSSVLRRDGATTVPPSLDVTAAKQAQFFTNKVDGVCAATENAPPPSFILYSGTQLTSLKMSQCVLDPLPTAVLR